MHRPLDQDVNWMSPVQGKSPLVQVKEPYGNLDMVTMILTIVIFIDDVVSNVTLLTRGVEIEKFSTCPGTS